LALAIAAIPLAYLLAALLGALVPVNRNWREPDEGVIIYLADNGIHADLVLPVNAEGLDWEGFVPAKAFEEKPGDARWIAFGAGERKVYLETPTWSDITPATIASAIIGGERVIHVEWVRDPAYSARQLRLTPEQYRRLWSAIRAEFRRDQSGRPVAINHPGYWRRDAFFEGLGQANAIDTCNQWVASRLRLAGIRSPLWSPFVQGLAWYYRPAAPPAATGQST
jgi:uncharacterized protein (TIGR02117 family)